MSGLRRKEAADATRDAEVGRRSWRTMSFQTLYQQPDETEVALRGWARVESCAGSCESRTMVSTLRACGSFVLENYDSDSEVAKGSLHVGPLCQRGVAADVEVPSRPSLERLVSFHPERKLVSLVRAKSTIGTQGDAATRAEARGAVPLDPIYQQSASIVMGVQAGAPMESPTRQCQRWEAQARDMVPGMLQLATEVPRKKFNRENAEASSETRWPLRLKRVRQLEE